MKENRLQTSTEWGLLRAELDLYRTKYAQLYLLANQLTKIPTEEMSNLSQETKELIISITKLL